VISNSQPLPDIVAIAASQGGQDIDFYFYRQILVQQIRHHYLGYSRIAV
jgi:hypothetical protein